MMFRQVYPDERYDRLYMLIVRCCLNPINDESIHFDLERYYVQTMVAVFRFVSGWYSNNNIRIPTS